MLSPQRFLLRALLSLVSFIGIIYVSVHAVPSEAGASSLLRQRSNVSLSASKTSGVIPCPAGIQSSTGATRDKLVTQLTASVNPRSRSQLRYEYTTTGGRIRGEGPKVTWDLTGSDNGTYTATVQVFEGSKSLGFSSATFTLKDANCIAPCPVVTVDCPSGLTNEGTPVTFKAEVWGGAPGVTKTYKWSVSAGTITDGEDTSSITVDTTGLAGQTVTATVKIGGYPSECRIVESCSAQIQEKTTPRRRTRRPGR